MKYIVIKGDVIMEVETSAPYEIVRLEFFEGWEQCMYHEGIDGYSYFNHDKGAYGSIIKII